MDKMMKPFSLSRLMTLILTLLLCLSTHFTAASTPPTFQLPFDKLTTYLDAMAENQKLMSAVYISKNGQVLYQHYAGFASVQDNAPITADTRFRIGSITKTFTSVLVMQLAEQSKLSLDDNLRKHFNEKFVNSDKITIRQLLNHRSGIPNFTNEPAYVNYMERPQKIDTMLKRVLNLGTEFEPGSEHRYSNSNYLLLGIIIEKIYGKTFAEVVEEKITNPLGLKNTYYGNSIEIEENEASSYRFSGEWQIQPETHMSVPHAAGAMVSTAKETAQFMQALFTGKLVSDESLKTMMEFRDGYGLGMFPMPFNEQTFYGHNGGIDGFVSSAGFNMADGIAFSILSNGVNMNFNDLLIAAASSVYGMEFQIPDFSAKPIKLAETILKMAEGEYASNNLPLDITFWVEDGVLMSQATGQGGFPLTPYSETEFRFDPAGIVLKFDADTIKSNQFTEFYLYQGGGTFLFQKK